MNQYDDLPRIGQMLVAVSLDYVENIHQNQVILSNAAAIKQEAEKIMRTVGPGHPLYQAAKNIHKRALDQEAAEQEEDFRHKEIKTALRECMPALLQILRVLQSIAPGVEELMPKLKKLGDLAA